MWALRNEIDADILKCVCAPRMRVLDAAGTWAFGPHGSPE